MKGDTKVVTQQFFDECLSFRDAQELVFTRLDDGSIAIRVAPGDLSGLADSFLKKTPKITNISALDKNTEYSHTFQDDTKSFLIQARTSTRIHVSWVSGETDTNYMTIGIGGNYRESGMILPTGSTIYFKCDNDNRTVEIIEWT